jgi:hypothetical protein
MAEGGTPLDEFDTTTPYDDVNDTKGLQDILNDSKYETVQPLTIGTLEDTKLKMLNEDLSLLKSLVETDANAFLLETPQLRQRLMRKGKELYLRTKGPGIKTVTFGTHKYKAIQITEKNGKNLVGLNTLISNGMSKQDAYYKILGGEQETSFISGTAEQIDSTETLRKSVAFVYNDMTINQTSTPLRPMIEEIPRQLEQAHELDNVLTTEDRQTIVKYLDFVQKNYDKKIQLFNDIESNKKIIDDAERELLSETREDKINELKKKISDSKANIQSSKQMLDQILAYNERQFENINTRLKSKTTLGEKLGNIFRTYGLTITAITLALGLIIDVILRSLGGPSGGGSSSTGSTGSGITDKIKQSLKNFSNWLLEMSKKAISNLPAIIGSIVSFLLKTTASIVGFLAENLILLVIALAFALYEAIKVGYKDIKRRRK